MTYLANMLFLWDESDKLTLMQVEYMLDGSTAKEAISRGPCPLIDPLPSTTKPEIHQSTRGHEQLESIISGLVERILQDCLVDPSSSLPIGKCTSLSWKALRICPGKSTRGKTLFLDSDPSSFKLPR